MLQILIKQIESSDDIHTISSAIGNLLSLTQDGPQLCSIIAKVTWSRSGWTEADWTVQFCQHTMKQIVIIILLCCNYRFLSTKE